MKSKTFFLGVLIAVFFASAAFAAPQRPAGYTEAPQAVHEEQAIELVPIRVWVFPGLSDGVQVSGHYEYFDMYMDMGKTKTVVDAIPAVPAIPTQVRQQGSAPSVTE